jgi:hypothetical protein
MAHVTHSEALRPILAELAVLYARIDVDASAAIGEVRALFGRVATRRDLSSLDRGAVGVSASAVAIDAGAVARDMAALREGAEWAADVAASDELPDSLRAQGRYHHANSLLAQFDVAARPVEAPSPDPQRPGPFTVADRLAHADLLRDARVLLASVADDTAITADIRSRAWCNLGNTLDASGRWIEAYDAYVESLIADPTNGNAAGNAVIALRHAAYAGLGAPGHLMAVSDGYVRLAQQNRERTVEVASATTADRWDRLAPSRSQGHVRHDGDALNPYQQWILRHRLALAPVVEGLGQDEGPWDSAMVHTVHTPPHSEMPTIFAMMNVLKGDYLAARRLGFTAEQMLVGHDGQHPDDSGTYVDTADQARYGEPTAMLVLAQRSTLDVLDKIAVVANEHFTAGIRPDRVDFRSFWQVTNSIRPQLVLPGRPGFTALALAELAMDSRYDGVYAGAQALRNAGTHRIVRVMTSGGEGVSTMAMSSIGLDELMQSVIRALRVTRAAYLYLIGLVHETAPTLATG